MEAPCALCWYRHVNNVLRKNKTTSEQIQQSSDPLLEDVLLQVFDYLDEEDLDNCETVCRRWQELIQSYTWKNVLRIKRKHEPIWQTYWERSEMDKNLNFLEDWEKYKIISSAIKALHNHWWYGNFPLSICNFIHHEGYFGIHKKCLVLMRRNSSFMIFDRRTMEFIHEITARGSQFTCFSMSNGIMMCGTLGIIKVYDLSTGIQINEFAEPNGWAVKCVCFGEHGLAVTISHSGTITWLRFWRVATSGEITCLNYISIPAENDCTYSLGMDTNFVIISQRCTVSKIFIVSTETRKIVETLTDSSIKLVRYEQGLLIIQYASFIRVGILSHRTPMPIQFFLDLGKYRNYGQIDIMTNSMYLALLDKGPDNNSTLTLYDIRAIKMKANRSNVATIKFNFLHVHRAEMDETQLVLIGHRHWSLTSNIIVNTSAKIAVLDFGQIKPLCEKHQGPYTAYSGHSKSEVMELFRRNNVDITKSIPCFRFDNICMTSARSKYSNAFNWLAVSACACFMCCVLIKDVRKLRFHGLF